MNSYVGVWIECVVNYPLFSLSLFIEHGVSGFDCGHD